MKAILSVAVMAAMLGGASSLQAATTKKKAKKVKKTVAMKTVKAKSKVKKANPLSFGLRVENEYEGADLNKVGVRTGTTYFQLRANYKISSKLSFRLNQELTQAYTDGERTKAAVGDTYLQLANSSLTKLGKTPVSGYVRAYLPTSINTREQKNQYLELRAEAKIKFIKTKYVSVSAHTHGRYYAAEKYQDATTSVAASGVTSLAANGKANQDYRLRNYFTASLNVGKFYAIQQLGVQHDFYKDNVDVGTIHGKPHLYAYAETGYQVTKNVGLELGAYSKRKMDVAGLDIYDTDDNTYYMSAAVSF